jgi:hypothetical protein
MKEYSKSIDLKMAFTAQLLKGCIGSDIVKVVSRYLSPKNATFEQMCKLGIIEQILEYYKEHISIININMGLMYACKVGYLEVANIMIEKGATKWNCGLRSACECGHLEMVSLMIKKGAYELNYGLYNACKGGHIKIVKLMIEKGANDWNWGLSGACKRGHFASGNPFCAKDIKRALLEANARSTHLEIVKLMIEKGANDWNWGLRNACYDGHLEIVNLMIEKGANDWNRGLINACQGGHLEIVNLMIEAGEASVSGANKGANNWNTGLYYACQIGHLEIVNLMIKKGATRCENCDNCMTTHCYGCTNCNNHEFIK